MIKTYDVPAKYADELKQKNKNLTEALSRLSKVSMKCLDGDAPIQELQDCINEANDVMIGNSVNLIDFPSYLKKGYKKFYDNGGYFTVHEIIDIYNEWNK